MLNIKETTAKYSAISAIGEQVRQLEAQSGEKYLYLNQGVNAVVPIDLSKVIPLIDFNAKDIQVYAPMKGRPLLKKAIIKTYFKGSSRAENLLINNGGMSGLDLIFQTLDLKRVILPSFFWGSYANIMKIRNIDYDFYANFDELKAQIGILEGCAVVICDPNNPLGNKFDDKNLIDLIKFLDEHQVTVLVDSPYRGVFYANDAFYSQIGQLANVIILESFSKSIGLSGQRIGFIHSTNELLLQQLSIRLMYASNGVNSFAQVLVEKLLTTPAGNAAVNEFRKQTTRDILLNINYLKERGFLAEQFYKNSQPKGIFVVVKFSAEELLKHHIAGISLSFFTAHQKEEAAQFSRICVSVPHHELKLFFDKI